MHETNQDLCRSTEGSALSGDDFLAVRNPKQLPARLKTERIPLGRREDVKPFLAVLASGDLLTVAFRVAYFLEGRWQPAADLPAGFWRTLPPGTSFREDVILFRSQDGGRTWTETVSEEMHGRETLLSVTMDGTVFGVNHIVNGDEHNEMGYTYTHIFRSMDHGKTWQTTEILKGDLPGISPDAMFVNAVRNVLELSDGTLALGVGGPKGADYLWRSRDGGKSWDKTAGCVFHGFDVGPAELSYSPFCEGWLWQPRCGDLLLVSRVDCAWVRPISNGDRRPTGLDHYERMVVFRSPDAGLNWYIEPELGSDYGEHYQSILRLNDGRLLLTFTVRDFRPPLGVNAVLGRETETGFCFDFQKDRIVIDEKTPAGMVTGGGFGNSVQLEDGTLVSAYSYRGKDNRCHIEVVRWRLPETD